MRLTRAKSIELCIKLWTWLAKTGKRKEDWPEWEKYDYGIVNDCWFCEYDLQRTKANNKTFDTCRYCPLGGVTTMCLDTAYGKWAFTRTPATRKKYAALFLQQIRDIK
jgi:hypothetical protein